MSVYIKFFARIYDYLNKHPQLKNSISLIIVLVFLGLGIWLRSIPAFKYGLELHANDPWIEYWQANYTYHHGLGSWYTLTRSNPATHIFWYPWGRDFTLSSYPGQPIWSALTYPIGQAFGLSIKQWVALQPLIFAAFATLAVFFAVRELMDKSDLAGIAAVILYTLVPATSDRNIVGFVEKEGLAIPLIFLSIYFYSKLVKIINNREVGENWRLLYSFLTGLSIAAVGWFWGGYVYVLGSYVLFLVLYPLFAAKEINYNFIKYNLLVFAAAIALEVVSPKNLSNLGFYPRFRINVGVLYIAALILPIIFYLLYRKYKMFGFKRPLLTPTRYLALLIVVGLAGIAAISMDLIHISARYAWALGLRFIKAPPLVQSVEEHQPALAANGLIGVLSSWGTGFAWLFFVSPLVLALLGGFYLLYKGRADRIYAAIAFFIAFYAYMNATYFEAAASAYGVVVAATFTGYLLSKAFPSPRHVEMRRRGRVTLYTRSEYSWIALILIALVFVNLAQSGVSLYESHSRMVYSIMAGGAPLAATTDAWYKTLDYLQHNLSRDSVVVAWWDYGYWISVGGHRKSVADGATLNGTQISILGRILTTKNESELIELLKLLRAPANNTYILTFDVFQFIPSKDGKTYTVIPVIPRRSGMIGLVDIPKSIWMVRIGRGQSYMSQCFYLYKVGDKNLLISPRFDDPNNLPLIYKIMVDGILYLNYQDKNHTYTFVWYTGSVSSLSYEYKFLEDSMGIKYQVNVFQQKQLTFLDRPKMKYLKPEIVIAEPFKGLHTGQGVLVDVVFIYKVVFPSDYPYK